MDQNTIVEITTIEQLLEMSAMGAGAVQGAPVVKKDKEMTEHEKILREHIRRKLKNTLNEQVKQEYELRMIIRNLLNEGDLSDTHRIDPQGLTLLKMFLKSLFQLYGQTIRN